MAVTQVLQDSNSGSNVPEGDAEEKECSIENGVAERRGGKCVVVSCDEGYYKPAEGDTCLEGGNKRHRPCVIENGEGELTWSPRKGAWNDECQLIACNAGYDDADNDNDCEETIAEYYSTAGSKSREPCTGKPDDSSWTVATGLANANECKWTCNAGYDDHNDDGTCSVTDAGHYSPAGNSDRISCNTVTAPNDATADPTSTGLSSANQCWTCNAGYDDHNDDGTCSVTDAGHYSPDGNSDRISCSTVTTPDDATADSASTGLSFANQCWTCNAGHDDHDDDGACSVTDAGHYSPDGNSDRISCNTVTAPDDATADSASTGLSSANQCWTCNAGYDDHDDDGTCSVTDAGHYSPDGNSDRISCSTVTAPDDATADPTSTGLSSANQCWTCNAGFDDHNDDGTCSVTDAGHYSPDGNSDRISCAPSLPDDATADPTSTGLSSDANQCWTCNAGFDDHDDDGTCSVTDAGHYSPDGNSDRISCTVPDDAKADPTSTGLSSDANQCWTCNGGFDDHNDDGTCSVTDAGHYSPDGNSDRISCSTVTAPDDATADSYQHRAEFRQSVLDLRCGL